ncbi:hypothetical protein BWI96_09415 [Siphonobacter sp. SORGH_AS_0500]|uniref:outer membrane beta-barrel protein n=1 Tax=Siphonobacter sp. SORGH_AS_0500 TaxID=1864824 RepID=UPI000CB2D19F|nr:outer membrane beta-barrel protein [Siphonobacter sp. SORGH_AS_0500]PKK36599.1 hypothetical protein BWI96_09415 [Siphonobacter sp. SORGH_AS_0500]
MKRSLIAIAALSTLTSVAFGQAPADTLPTLPTKPVKVLSWIPAVTHGMDFSFGLNALNVKNSNGISGYDLRPLGSRFVSIGSSHRFRLYKGNKAAFALKTGVEVSWNNFMFQENNVVNAANGQVTFPEAGRPLQKSKLTAAYLNIPVMPTVVFREGVVSQVSFGGYAGMRLDSYTKIKDQDGNKSRDHGRFYMNNIRYGVALDIAFRKAGSFFVQYDLNNVFQTNKGPEMSAINFGIRL